MKNIVNIIALMCVLLGLQAIGAGCPSCVSLKMAMAQAIESEVKSASKDDAVHAILNNDLDKLLACTIDPELKLTISQAAVAKRYESILRTLGDSTKISAEDKNIYFNYIDLIIMMADKLSSQSISGSHKNASVNIIEHINKMLNFVQQKGVRISDEQKNDIEMWKKNGRKIYQSIIKNTHVK